MDSPDLRASPCWPVNGLARRKMAEKATHGEKMMPPSQASHRMHKKTQQPHRNDFYNIPKSYYAQKPLKFSSVTSQMYALSLCISD